MPLASTDHSAAAHDEFNGDTVLAVRIYALAKELDIDSKELVDACDRCGIPGKGSALASLNDDEVTKVKSYLAGPSKPAAKTDAPAPVPTPDAARKVEKIKVIVAAKKPTPSRSTGGGLLSAAAGKAEEAPVESAPEQESAPASDAAPAEAASAETETGTPGTPGTAEPKPTQEAASSEPPSPAEATTPTEATSPAQAAGTSAGESKMSGPNKPGPMAGMLRPEDYIGPGGAMGKPRVVGGGKKDAAKPKRPGEGPKARPVVKLAAMPARAVPKKPEKPKEEVAVQKPDMKLPTEAFGAGGKGGSKPLARHMRAAEKTLEAEKIRAKQAEETGRKGRRGGTPAADDKPMLGGREERQLNRSRTPGGRNRFSRPSFRSRRKRTGINTAAPRKDRITVELPCTVRDLSEAGGVPAMSILRMLMQEGMSLGAMNINTLLDPELAEFVAEDLGIDVDFVMAQTLEDRVLSAIADVPDPEEDMAARPPVVTFLGHVDHGKTSLLDRLIGIDVASRESGGITQHIRAYQIDKDGRKISFLDTPGHEAFTAMRARGANVTDIAVLVVAADDGVMPQTEEAISHAKAAEVPIIVALNKMDLPGANVDKAMQDLATNELLPVEWGGDVEVVKTSAATGEGLDDLLETILTVSELNEYQANPNRKAIGVCIESQQDADQGVVSKMIVERGTLRVGDIIVCGDAYGRVKAMVDPLNPAVTIDEAGPSMPVDLLGFDSAPPGGEHFYVLDDVGQARDIAADRAHQTRTEDLLGSGYQHVTLDTLFDRLEGAEEVQTLNLIIRADVRGSIEAIRKELGKLSHPEVRLRILQASVGGVSEADIHLANASDAIVIAFNVVPDERARSLADQTGVEVRRYSIIYNITDELQAAMEGLLKPEKREVELGRALIQQVFKISRLGAIAGCRVIQGVVERNARARVIRDSMIVGDYPIDTLRREKDDTKEVREGYECGIKLSGFNDIKEADLLEVYKVEEVARTFDD